MKLKKMKKSKRGQLPSFFEKQRAILFLYDFSMIKP